jgi:hypothetical protein
MMHILAAADYSSAEYAAQITQTLFASVTVAVLWIVSSLVLASIFWKADEERWKAWIPFWRDYVFFKLARLPGALAAFVPGGLLLFSIATLVSMPLLNNVMVSLAYVCFLVVGVLQYVSVFRIAQSFKKFTLGWILMIVFLPGIFLIVVAFDKSVWHDEDELRLNFKPAARIGKQVR